MVASPTPADTQADTPARPRRRDSARTRQRLLDAARSRFAQHGYAGTAVREIAEEAGVNVALINRYFESKDGLFAACLAEAIDELRRDTADAAPDALPSVIAGQVAGSGVEGGHYEHLLVLVRSSGDERADRIRAGVLRDYSEALASRAGWRPDDPRGEELLLRAQVVLSTAIGMVLLRSSGLQPLAATSAHDLVAPLRTLITTMLIQR